MPIEMVLNELSWRQPAPSIREAQQWMDGLLDTIIAATNRGVSRVLRTKEDFSSAFLAPDYPVARWRNDATVDRERRGYLRSLTTKAPFLADLTDPATGDQVSGAEFSHDGELSEGLGLAYLLGALAVSLQSEPRWEASRLTLAATWLRDDARLTTDEVTVVHASKAAHVQEHTSWIAEQLKASVLDGSDLWHRRNTLFQSLTFCAAVDAHIGRLGHGSPILQSVLRRLFELENYAKTWDTGAFDPSKLPSKASPESAATLQEFGNERTFIGPDGVARVFSWHVRLTPAAWRIHFFPAPDSRTMLIGYIGPHLPTASDPT